MVHFHSHAFRYLFFLLHQIIIQISNSVRIHFLLCISLSSILFYFSSHFKLPIQFDRTQQCSAVHWINDYRLLIWVSTCVLYFPCLFSSCADSIWIRLVDVHSLPLTQDEIAKRTLMNAPWIHAEMAANVSIWLQNLNVFARSDILEHCARYVMKIIFFFSCCQTFKLIKYETKLWYGKCWRAKVINSYTKKALKSI